MNNSELTCLTNLLLALQYVETSSRSSYAYIGVTVAAQARTAFINPHFLATGKWNFRMKSVKGLVTGRHNHNSYNFSRFTTCEPDNSLGVVSVYGLDDRGSIPGRDERFIPLTSVSRPALGPTQPPVHWVPGVLSPGVKRGRGVTLITHLLLAQRSRMSRSYIFSPPQAPPWRVVG
jgi:hypothetical protein